jgi:hypothetical protein
MKTLWLALRAFFRTLFDRSVRAQIERALLGEAPAVEEPAEVKPAPARPKVEKPKTAIRSEALTLLAALQREARLIDFLQEPIGDYTDAQIGAAVRDIHRDAHAVLERLFGLRPLRSEPEGAALDIPPGFDAAQFHLTGNVTGQPPYRGTLCHAGWQATRSELPAWTGNEASRLIVAPAEVELKA